MPIPIYLVLLIGSLMGIAAASATSSEQLQQQIVHRYIAAFNARDTESMLNLTTDDVQWLSIDGEKISKETNNQEELRKGMEDYFESCSSCKSRLTHIFSTGSRVSTLEIASYANSQGAQQQQSLAVYEFSGLLIKRVYYFPAEK